MASNMGDIWTVLGEAFDSQAATQASIEAVVVKAAEEREAGLLYLCRNISLSIYPPSLPPSSLPAPLSSSLSPPLQPLSSSLSPPLQPPSPPPSPPPLPPRPPASLSSAAFTLIAGKFA